MTFHETLDAHLRAIKSRNLPALIDTLPADTLTLVMSNGKLVRNVDEFVALHRDWFGSGSWSLETELVSAVEAKDLGLALLRLDYRDRTPGGEPVHEASYLTLAFQRQGDKWVMIHDANTPIRQAA